MTVITTEYISEISHLPKRKKIMGCYITIIFLFKSRKLKQLTKNYLKYTIKLRHRQRYVHTETSKEFINNLKSKLYTGGILENEKPL